MNFKNALLSFAKSFIPHAFIIIIASAFISPKIGFLEAFIGILLLVIAAVAIYLTVFTDTLSDAISGKQESEDSYNESNRTDTQEMVINKYEEQLNDWELNMFNKSQIGNKVDKIGAVENFKYSVISLSVILVTVLSVFETFNGLKIFAMIPIVNISVFLTIYSLALISSNDETDGYDADIKEYPILIELFEKIKWENNIDEEIQLRLSSSIGAPAAFKSFGAPSIVLDEQFVKVVGVSNLKGILVHEMQHANQRYLKYLQILRVPAILSIVILLFVFASIGVTNPLFLTAVFLFLLFMVLSATVKIARYAEKEADKEAIHQSNSLIYASVLSRIPNVSTGSFIESLVIPHPPIEERVEQSIEEYIESDDNNSIFEL